MMTKELHDSLIKYEQIFRTAIEAKYYRAMDSRFSAAFFNGCKEMNVYVNQNCPSCMLKAIQTLGKLYFDYKEPEAVEAEDNKTIKEEKKDVQKASKQPKKPIVTRSKTNKK